MARTNDAAVKALLLPGRDYDTEQAPSLTPFIDTASAMVDDVADCITAKGGTAHSVSRLELIERWLSAHYFKVSDKGYSSRSTEGASGAFDGQTAMYLESTLYGQTALRLDSSGCLEAAGGAGGIKTAGAGWMGRPPSEQTDYVDRN
jgi:hypothetical protein